jgi:Protein of unknown function (DUF3122)
MLYWKSLLLVILTILITLSSSPLCPPAIAEIRQFHETPGTLLYKSQWTLKDQTGKSWQAIAFQIRSSNPQEPFTVQLRLVGFPNSITLDSTQPLRLDDRQQFLTAPSTAANLPGSVGQFDLQPILPQLNPKLPLYLTLATAEAEAAPRRYLEEIAIKVPPFLVEEWQSLPNRVE